MRHFCAVSDHDAGCCRHCCFDEYRHITKHHQADTKSHRDHQFHAGWGFKQRVDVKTNTRELLELKDSINYLADTLEEEDTLRRQLTSDMAHEIRTPVNNVQNIWKH